MKQGEIKVYFIKFSNHKPNTASENRFLGLVKMTSYNFDCEVIHTAEIGKFFTRFKFIRGILYRIRAVQATINIARIKDSDKINILYLFGVDPLLSLYYSGFCKLFDVLLVSERNEFPQSIIKNKRFLTLFNSIFICPWYYKLFQGYTLISDELMNHFKKYSTKTCVLRKLPMTVDFSRFSSINKSANFRYVFYAGSLNNDKDGVEYLIHAFMSIIEQIKDVDLLIAGNSGIKDMARVKKLIHEYKSNRIKLLGLVDRKDMPEYIINSSVCVLPRPDSIQAQGGFPTKLGEYLASGNPVIVTDVGEIPTYMTNNEVYMISCNNIEHELEITFKNIFSDYKIASQKGILGQRKAIELFSLESNRKIIREFILSVVSNN